MGTSQSWQPAGGGATGALVRSFNWARTPLGSMETWSTTMQCIVQTLLSSPVAMASVWGDQGILIYNDRYADVCGPRHPEALGRPLLDIWPEAREFNSNIISAGLQGRSLSFHAQEFELWRHGYAEQVWMDLEYTPIKDERGVPVGVLAIVLDVTELVRKDRVLQNNESRLRGFVDATSDMIYRMSPDWRELRQLDGRGVLDSVSEPMADWIETFIFEEDRQAVRAAVADAIGKKGRFEVETRVHLADGGVGWSLSRAVPVFDAEGRVVEWFGAASDITDRKETQAALAASEARFRGVWDSGVLGFTIFDVMTGETIAINEKLLSLTGHSREDFDGGTWDWREFTPAEHLHRDERAVREAQESGFWQPFEKDFIHKSGARLPVRLSSAPLPGEPGKVVVVVSDLSAERAAEDALRASEERLRLATEAAEIGYWDVDEVNHRLDWPARVKGMFGISAEQSVTMKDFYDGLHPEDRERVSAAYAGAADPDRRAVYEVDYRTIGKEDGLERWVSAKGRGVFDERGRCLRVIGTVIDVTDRKRAEAALAKSEARLRELNDTLEQRIADRTAELEKAHEELRQAQKMQALGQLTGGIAHDFNNLLQAVMGSLNLIQKRAGDPDRVARLAENGLAAAERGAKLTGQLLAFSRSQRMEVLPVALGPLLDGFTEMAARAIGPEYPIRLRNVAPDLHVMCDGVQLEMALLNLAMNARDAMPGGGTVWIDATPLQLGEDNGLADGSYIDIVVSDQGTGMPPDVVARAFEPFFTTKTVGRGTGLGLSQVYGMTRQSGGTARVDSIPDQGTSVHLLLRRAFPEAGTAGIGGDGGIEADHTARVLVVDDDPDVRRAIVAILEDFGHVCVSAADGMEGVRMFQENSPDLVIIDFAMPGMNGAEVASAIRSIKPDTPIILASGYSDTSAIENAVGRDAPMLRKPFTADQLKHALQMALERS